ncbi:ubiquinone biosynthesis monooxygenase COQ6 [Rhizophagus clarus]|uniref:Ubiquinone biosynthesis monooxygenase COQ6, mitochondrial n=1 Tax=Rhizophagus clarus TaxID=94130 RepID=A0A8H3ML68_9GLOM|nr:ubiquinone biosynthesis monooxygenase COQ6 [Rhizophagus clarus]
MLSSFNSNISLKWLFIRYLATVSSSSSSDILENIYDIVIVGGGISGSALACALASSPKITGSQKRVALIESSDMSNIKEWKPVKGEFSNRVSSLTPRSVEFFKDIGVWHNIEEERIKPFSDMQVWDGVSDARIKFNNENNRTGPLAWILENYNIHHAILKTLDQYKENSDVDLLDNTKVQKIFFDKENKDEQFDLSDWPCVELSNGKKLKTRLLVGADGINSPVRSFANIDSLGWDYNSHAVVATLHVDPSIDNKTAWQRFLPTGPIAMLPLQNGYSSMVWSTTPNLATKIRSMPSNDFVHLVNAAFQLRIADLEYFYSQLGDGESIDFFNEFEWRKDVQSKNSDYNYKEEFPPLVLGVQDKSRAGFPLKMRNSENYIKERIVLVGDAAHTIHPLAGQGLNQGLADVQCLLKVIEQGITNGQDIGDINLLREYSSERYFANIMMLGVVDKLHKLFSTNLTPIVLIRSFGLKVLNNFEPIKAEIMKFAMGTE